MTCRTCVSHHLELANNCLMNIFPFFNNTKIINYILEIKKKYILNEILNSSDQRNVEPQGR